MGLLDGKKGLILNVANDRSIAWHIANNAIKHGAKCGFGYLPMEKMERRARKAMEEGGFGQEWLFPCDVSKDEDIEKFFAAAREQFGTIDFLVHSLAFADRNYLKTDSGRLHFNPSRCIQSGARHQRLQPDRPDPRRRPADAQRRVHHRPHLSGQRKSRPRLQRHGRRQGRPRIHRPLPRLRPGREEDPREHPLRRPRRNPQRRGVGGFEKILDHVPTKAPLKRNIDADEVGKTAVFLLSDLSSGVTGENLYVDAGFNTVGL